MKKKVSIITINYNALEDTKLFLASIEAGMNCSNLDLEVIVVDNASKVCPQEILEIYPWVRLVKSKYNLGFAGGNNLGAFDSNGDYLFFINNDTALNLIDLEELVAQYESNPEYGLLTPVILNEDRSIQYAGYTEINTLTGRNKLINQLDESQGIKDTGYPHGAAMLISRENFEKVGMMSEDYFLYYEELDWGSRIRSAGLKIGVCLSSRIIHKESASVGKVSECKLYFMTRNRILYVRKHFTKMQQLIFSVFFFLFSTPKNLLTFLLRQDFNSIRVFIAAVTWHFTNDRSSRRLGYKFDGLLKQ
ncbi:MAG: glycosyltransferase family 2 protein [Ekhidna sp.]|nr:glycosyltransferase family 2 protein [Ekhidna sp.]MBC6409738.1 glycosyltransferase family 2 protein [Ekhidna sp.]